MGACFCLARPSSPDVADTNHGERDELEGLLASDDAADTLSLHSNVGRRRGKNKKKKTRRRVGWGIAGRDQNSTGPKTVQLFGWHLFGKPLHTPPEEETPFTNAQVDLSSSDEGESDREGLTSTQPGPSSMPRLLSTSTLDSIPDAAPLEESAIARLVESTQPGAQWGPERTDEELAREELELARAEEAAAGTLGVPIVSPKSCPAVAPLEVSSDIEDTPTPKSRTHRSPMISPAQIPSPPKIVQALPPPSDTQSESSSTHTSQNKTPLTADEQRIAAQAKAIRRAMRNQRKRLQERAEAEADLAAGGFDNAPPPLHPDGGGFEGFQGSGEDGVVVLPLHLTSHEDEFGPFVHPEHLATSSHTSSSRSRSRRSAPLEDANTTLATTVQEDDFGDDGVDYGMEYAGRSKRATRPDGESGSAGTSQRSKSVSWVGGSDRGGSVDGSTGQKPKSKSKSRSKQGVLPNHVPLPPSSTGSNEHLYYQTGSHPPFDRPIYEDHPLASTDPSLRKHKKKRSQTSHQPNPSQGSVHSSSSMSLPPTVYQNHTTSPLTHGYPQEFNGVPGGDFDGTPGGFDGTPGGFDGVPGDFEEPLHDGYFVDPLQDQSHLYTQEYSPLDGIPRGFSNASGGARRNTLPLVGDGESAMGRSQRAYSTGA